jgi:FtsZ-interacting cell division protein YlmF
MRKFGSLSKTLTTSRLNFVDTDLSSKTGLKRPKRVYKRATVARQLRPFHISSVALLQIRRAQARRPVGFSDGFKPVSRSVWRVLVEVFLLILLTVIRHLAGEFSIGLVGL